MIFFKNLISGPRLNYNYKKSIESCVKIFIFLVFLIMPNNVFGQAINSEQKFLDWTVYKVQRGHSIVCYMVSIPISKIMIEGKRNADDRKPKNKKNKDKKVKKPELLPYFLVTNIKNNPDEISVYSGFNYQKDSEVKISFPAKSFYLFSYINIGWANDVDEDTEIIKELQKNVEMTIISSSDQNYITKDTYSLIGFSMAYRKMKEICSDND